MKKILFGLIFILASSSSWANVAQPVPIPEDPSTMPQVQIDGVGIGTLKYGRQSADKYEGGIDFSDTAVVLGASQRLYDGAIGSLGLGGVTIDESNEGLGTSFFLHQAFLDYQARNWEFLVGRTDNPTAHLVDFPTLRGDDLVRLTNPLDPFSNGANKEEHRYSNVASVTLNQNLTTFENFHVQHLVDSQGLGTGTRITSFGASLESMSPPGLEALQRIVSAGIGYEHEIDVPSAEQGLNMVYAGGVLNLNKSVTQRWDLRVQDIVNFGSRLTHFQAVNDSFQADANTIAAAIRYLDTPFGRPGYQLSLTGAYKNYFKVENADSVGIILTGIKRLGQGFDLAVQYLGEWQNSNLIAAANGFPYQQQLEVGFVINFESTFNEHIPPRRSLLNLQHPFNP